MPGPRTTSQSSGSLLFLQSYSSGLFRLGDSRGPSNSAFIEESHHRWSGFGPESDAPSRRDLATSGLGRESPNCVANGRKRIAHGVSWPYDQGGGLCSSCNIRHGLACPDGSRGEAGARCRFLRSRCCAGRPDWSGISEGQKTTSRNSLRTNSVHSRGKIRYSDLVGRSFSIETKPTVRYDEGILNLYLDAGHTEVDSKVGLPESPNVVGKIVKQNRLGASISVTELMIDGARPRLRQPARGQSVLRPRARVRL